MTTTEHWPQDAKDRERDLMRKLIWFSCELFRQKSAREEAEKQLSDHMKTKHPEFVEVVK